MKKNTTDSIEITATVIRYDHLRQDKTMLVQLANGKIMPCSFEAWSTAVYDKYDDDGNGDFDTAKISETLNHLKIGAEVVIEIHDTDEDAILKFVGIPETQPE